MQLLRWALSAERCLSFRNAPGCRPFVLNPAFSPPDWQALVGWLTVPTSAATLAGSLLSALTAPWPLVPTHLHAGSNDVWVDCSNDVSVESRVQWAGDGP